MQTDWETYRWRERECVCDVDGERTWVQAENTHLLSKGKYHCTTVLPICLYSAALLMCNQQQIYLFGQIKTSQTAVGKLYSDTSPCEVSECSLVQVCEGMAE